MVPKISVIIPSFNKKKYISQTIDSIVNQNHSNLEVIIQDGKSTNGSIVLIKKYAKKYGYIFWESRKDKGQTDVINKGLKKATGDILTFINADDYYAPNAFNLVAKAYLKNNNLLWIAGKGKVVNEKGEEVTKIISLYKSILLLLNLRTLLLIVNYLMQPSVFILRTAYSKFGHFSGQNKYVMEYKMWLMLSNAKMPYVLNANLAFFRLYKKSFSLSKTNEILNKDYEIAKEYTQNPIILLLHKIHNFFRLKII